MACKVCTQNSVHKSDCVFEIGVNIRNKFEISSSRRFYQIILNLTNPGVFQLPQAGLILVSSSNSGGFITCEFTRSITVPGQDKVFDLSQDYYILLAHGSIDSGTHT